MKPPSQKQVAGILLALDWTGHVELPDADIRWVAEQLAHAFDGKRGTCESCNNRAELLVQTGMGNICESCIEQFGQMAEEQRRGLE